MSMTIACYTAQAFAQAGYDVAQNHTECRQRGGVIYEIPSEPLPGSIQLGKPCECTCHIGQNRSWYPMPASAKWRDTRKVKPDPDAGPHWKFGV